MNNGIRKLIPNQVVNLFRHLPTAVLANLVHGFPSKKLKFIGVTGTDGKTTTTNMIYKILKDSGKKVSMVSTINAEIAGEKIETGFHVTNPDPFLLQKLIRKSADSGDEIFVLEVTSHGLDQFRDWGINFEVGVITNITREHLDYHKTFKNYFNAKARLIKNSKYAVLNKDEDSFAELKSIARGKVISFGLKNQADISPKVADLKLKMDGEFNKQNALAALAVAQIFGVNPEESAIILESFENLSGRMQEIQNKKGIKIFIDFAHTPNALKNAILTLKKNTRGKFIAVFGCAGQRDETKRSVMGEISGSLSDFTVITAEDPRGEVERISAEILLGAKKAGAILDKNVFVENDRQKAIELAVNKLAKQGDLIGIFGKGHEKTMNFDGRNEIPWSDEEAVWKALNEKR